MAQKTELDSADFIQPLDINGMEGRVLRIPPPKNRKREMLLVYGSHASLERMFSLAQELNRYGGITAPDLPGFGGMDSLFKIGRKADIDTMAEYLAAYVKLRYRRRRFTIIGMSYGFAVATRMLELHPDIAKRVDLIVSIAGFVHKDDFHVPRWQFLTMKYGTKFFKARAPSAVARLLVNKTTVSRVYNFRGEGHSKLKGTDLEARKKLIDFEVVLWRINDLRTYFYTAYTMFVLDICHARVDVPVYHVAISSDHFFNNLLVEQHLNVIYKKVVIINLSLNTHMPTTIASQKEVAPFIPTKLRRVLAAA